MDGRLRAHTRFRAAALHGPDRKSRRGTNLLQKVGGDRRLSRDADFGVTARRFVGAGYSSLRTRSLTIIPTTIPTRCGPCRHRPGLLVQPSRNHDRGLSRGCRQMLTSGTSPVGRSTSAPGFWPTSTTRPPYVRALNQIVTALAVAFRPESPIGRCRRSRWLRADPWRHDQQPKQRHQRRPLAPSGRWRAPC